MNPAKRFIQRNEGNTEPRTINLTKSQVKKLKYLSKKLDVSFEDAACFLVSLSIQDPDGYSDLLR